MSLRSKRSGKEFLPLNEDSILKDPYEILYAPKQSPCTLANHSKSTNCKNNPWCLIEMGEYKNGIWKGDEKFLQKILKLIQERRAKNAKYPISCKTLMVINKLLYESNSLSARTVAAQSQQRYRGFEILNPPIGLRNLGATCYLNVLIQCIYHNLMIREAILSIETVNINNNSPEFVQNMTKVLEALQAGFLHMAFYKGGSYDLKPFTSLLGLNESVQQDPQEFNKLFIEKLERLQSMVGSNGRMLTPNNPPKDTLTSLIAGTVRYEIQCMECKSVSARESVFHDLDLPVLETRTYLEDMLEGYLSEEIMDGSNKYECSVCAQRCRAVRRTIITKYPTVLFVQFNRYIYDIEAGRKKKLMSEVVYGREIELDAKVYTLTAVLHHKGKSAYSGHYVTEVLDWQSGDWWFCDDANTTKVCHPCSLLEERGVCKPVKVCKNPPGRKKSSSNFPVEECISLCDDELNQEIVNVDNTDIVDRGKRKRGISQSTTNTLEKFSNPEISMEFEENATKTPKSKGSKWPNDVNRLTDAYMLAYVDKEQLIARTKLLDISLDCTNGVLGKSVTNSNAEFDSKSAELNDWDSILANEVDSRVNCYRSIEKSLTPEVYCDEYGKNVKVLSKWYYLVPSVWLSNWICGIHEGEADVNAQELIEAKEVVEVDEVQPVSNEVVLVSDNDIEPVPLMMDGDIEVSGGNDDKEIPQFVYSEPYDLSSYICPHGKGIHPDKIGQLKIVSQRTHDVILGSLKSKPTSVLVADNECNRDFRSFMSEEELVLHQSQDIQIFSYFCDDCFGESLQHLSKVMKNYEDYTGVLSKIPIDDIEINDIKGKSGKYYWISRAWVQGLKKYNEYLAKFLSSSSSDSKAKSLNILESFFVADSSVEGQKEDMFDNSMNANNLLICEHGDLILSFWRKARIIGADCWASIVKIFPNSKALEVSRDFINGLRKKEACACEMCQAQSRSLSLSKEAEEENIRYQTNPSGCLYELYMRDQSFCAETTDSVGHEGIKYPPLFRSWMDSFNRIQSVSSSGRPVFRISDDDTEINVDVEKSLSVTFYLIDAEWLLCWRRYLKANTARWSLSQTFKNAIPSNLKNKPRNIFCTCDADNEERVVIPQWIIRCDKTKPQDAKGKDIPNIALEKVFANVEIITEDQWHAICTFYADIADPPFVMKFYIEREGFLWHWGREICEVCYRNRLAESDLVNTNFTEQFFNITVITSTSSQVLLAMIDSLHGTAEEASPTSKRGTKKQKVTPSPMPARRSKRSKLVSTVPAILSSTDTIAMVKYKVYQNCEGVENDLLITNPISQIELYNVKSDDNIVELVDAKRSLFDYGVQMTDSLYVRVNIEAAIDGENIWQDFSEEVQQDGGFRGTFLSSLDEFPTNTDGESEVIMKNIEPVELFVTQSSQNSMVIENIEAETVAAANVSNVPVLVTPSIVESNDDEVIHSESISNADALQCLIAMGFTNKRLNKQALKSANNDLQLAIAMLSSKSANF